MCRCFVCVWETSSIWDGWNDIIHLFLYKTRRKVAENRVYITVYFVIKRSNCNKPVTNVKCAYRLQSYKCITQVNLLAENNVHYLV